MTVTMTMIGKIRYMPPPSNTNLVENMSIKKIHNCSVLIKSIEFGGRGFEF